MSAMEPPAELRMYLGERVPSGGTEADTLFTDAELTYLLEQTNQSMNRAAAHGWAIKAAEYVNLIDMVEEGSERRLSQRYKHARLQAEYFAGLAALDAEKLLQSARSVVRGRAAAWGRAASSELPSDSETGEEVSPFEEKQYTRQYATYRMPAIKG